MLKELQAKGIKEQVAFPKKLLFSNFAPKRIEERKKQLEAYFNWLAATINLIEIAEACSFLEVEEFTRTLLLSLEYDLPDTSKPALESASRKESEETQPGGRREAALVRELLARLNNDPHTTTKALHDFEASYFGQESKLKKGDIKELLWGNQQQRGLLHFCGFTEKYITGSSCMQLFSKLIKYEYNSVAAEKVVQVFAMTDPALVRAMHLSYYISSITSHDSIGLVALYYYLNYNTHNVAEPQELLDTPESVSEYEKWVQNKVTCGMFPTH